MNALDFNNSIVDFATLAQARQTSATRFPNRAIRGRFQNRGPVQPLRVDQARAGVPGDRDSAALPISCYVQFQTTNRRDGEGHRWVSSGTCVLSYSESVLRRIVIEGNYIRFEKDLPGHEDQWCQIMNLRADPPLFGGDITGIEFELRRVDNQFNSLTEASA